MKKLFLFALTAVVLLAAGCKGKDANPPQTPTPTPTPTEDPEVTPPEEEWVMPEGALPGAFSVHNGQQVHFSRGNLRCQPSTGSWYFANSQELFIGADNKNIDPDYTSWIDLFGWGTGKNPALAGTDPFVFETFEDWGKNYISNGGMDTAIWRTLTIHEWDWLLHYRDNHNDLKGIRIVNDVLGAVLLPDDWKLPEGLEWSESKKSYDFGEWLAMEEAGAVFLPCAGFREDKKVENIATEGNYWTSSSDGSELQYGACFITFNKDKTPDFSKIDRHFGYSVRLVCDRK